VKGKPVADLGVGQAFAGQPHNLALLGRYLPQRIRFAEAADDGHSARSQLCLRPLCAGSAT
jgi:hypothetical protein